MISLASFAKINLFLQVLGARPDGYTEIRTIFQTIDLADLLTFGPAPSGVLEIACDDPAVPQGARSEENLVARSARVLREETGSRAGAQVAIRKRIPVGAGLGGGSSNAAAALVALDRLWNLGLGPRRLRGLAGRIGSDVPYFLHGGTALGLGRGERVRPLPDAPSYGLLLLVPPFPLSTREVYARARSLLTPRSEGHNIWRFALRDLLGGAGTSFVLNELEAAAADGHPELVAMRRRLVERGAVASALSGSGSAVYGLFPPEWVAGEPGLRRLAAGLEEEFAGTRGVVARTLGRGDYMAGLFGDARAGVEDR